MEFVGQLKKLNNANVSPESMFFFNYFRKIKETRLKFSQENVALL